MNSRAQTHNLAANPGADPAPNPGVDPLVERYTDWTLAHWSVLIFAASFLLLAIHPQGRLIERGVPFGGENVRVARSLASHGTFANPFATRETGTTAHVAPVYPFFYSLILRAFGTGFLALWILWVCNVSFLAIQLALLPVLSRRSGLGILPGVLAAALGAVSLFAPIDTRVESFLCGTLLICAWLLTTSYATKTRRSYSTVLLLGVVWGVIILTNPVMLTLLCAWSVCLLCFVMTAQARSAHRSTHGRAQPEWLNFIKPLDLIKQYAAVVVIALLVVSPWIARNYARFGAFIFVRDNLGLELYTSNNSCASPTLEQNIQSGCHARTHPNPTASIAAEVAGNGELQFNRARLHDALSWIAGHRAAFLSLTARRFRQFWLPNLENWRETAAVWLITIASLAGWWILKEKDRLAAWMMASTWLCFPLIYYVVQGDPRYRYPIYWTSLLAAGYALAQLIQWSRKTAPHHSSRH